VVLSVPVIVAVNAVRVIVSGLLQEQAGPEYVRGHWHEALGVAMVLVGVGLIVGIAALLGSRANPAREQGKGVGTPSPLAGEGSERSERVGGQSSTRGSGDPSPADSASQTPLPSSARGEGDTHPVADAPGSPRWAALLLLCSAVATVAAQFLGAGAEEEIVAAAPLDQIPRTIGRWEATDLSVPPEITEMLTPDAISHRVYRDAALGYEVHAWVIFWSSRNMVKGYHHPDVCWPNRGFRLQKREVVPLAAGGGTVPVTVREFARDQHRQLVLYWTQEGRRVWSAADEERVRATGDSHDWLGERLFRREPAAPTGRLVVLLGTPVWGDGAAIRSQTLELTAGLANELYRICPWAAPPTAEP
jgi:EpsI family protein